MLINIPLITIIIAVVACVYASFSDLKEGVIRNKLTFPLIAIGIVLNAIYVFTSTVSIFLFIECVIITWCNLCFWLCFLEDGCMGWWRC